MQEWAEDYSQDEDGCCLNCEDAEEGCLCYSCNCTKCYNYSTPDETMAFDMEGNQKGACDLVPMLKAKKAKQTNWNTDMRESGNYSRIGLKKSQKQLLDF